MGSESTDSDPTGSRKQSNAYPTRRHLAIGHRARRVDAQSLEIVAVRALAALDPREHLVQCVLGDSELARRRERRVGAPGARQRDERALERIESARYCVARRDYP